MLFLHVAASVLALSTGSLFAAASSIARNPLTDARPIQRPSIDTSTHRVTAHSRFDLSFDAFGRRIRFSLEPNDEIIPDGAQIQYLGLDGEVVRTEAINRLDHKVYRGDAWSQNVDGSFSKVGHARVSVLKDGVKPLFEGAFDVHHDFHHILLNTNFMKTRQEQDPTFEVGDEEYMVVFRDSDTVGSGRSSHSELKRREADIDVSPACTADSLEFNMDLDHPVYAGGLKTQNNFWAMPMSNLFGKRQLDTTPSGNSGGVNLVSTIGSSAGCPSTRKVALVGVATDCTYTATFNSTQSASANVINQINSASAVYEKTFNISLGLQNLTISPAECPGSPPASTPWNVPCSSNTDIQDRLNLFSQWRGSKQDTNSHWTLLTNCNSGSAVGLAWLGQACVISADARNSTSGGMQTIAGANVVAKTSTEWQVIAHETGHTFGAVHDCTSQTCSDGTSTKQQCCPLSGNTCDAGQKFIMNPSTAQGISNFSPCTIGNICSAMGRNSVKTSCFSSNKGVTVITGQQCGNGIVEQGEDCDCGGTEACGNNPCCNGATCKFKTGAVCDDSNEECCKNCQLATADVVCRPSTGVCDPEEKCSGSSAICPADQTKPDGSSCGNGLSCASGQCTSRDQQCKTIMGSYTSGKNDTYACDSSSCTLSCASPEFGPSMCYGLNQNFLDGTACGGGGKCANGQCKGTSVGKEIKSWIEQHRNLVIGIGVALGVFLLLCISSCIYSSIRRRKMGKMAAQKWPSMRQRVGYQQTWSASTQNGYGTAAPHVGNVDAGWYNNNSNNNNNNNYQYGYPSPPPAFSSRSARYA